MNLRDSTPNALSSRVNDINWTPAGPASLNIRDERPEATPPH
ncbi:hypothetical protein [Paraburkholderia sp. CNPSo 3274]|nr:hypothetical protein [Paraburkholderia sp. CNPSo 3274]